MIEDLSKEDLRNGVHLIIANAEELLADAELLFKNNRYLRTYSLSQFCIEEIGKASLIFDVIIFKGQNETAITHKDFIKKFFNHKDKTHASTIADFDIRHKEDDDEKLIEELLLEIDKTSQYDTLKNISLYTDFKKNNFSVPNEIITKEIAENRLLKAKERFEWVKNTLKKRMMQFKKKRQRKHYI